MVVGTVLVVTDGVILISGGIDVDGRVVTSDRGFFVGSSVTVVAVNGEVVIGIEGGVGASRSVVEN